MKIYLDVCCLNRPFDDQSQSRVHLEAEAVMAVMNLAKRGHWTCVVSEVVFDEIAQTLDSIRRMNVELLASDAMFCRMVTEDVVQRAEHLETMGFGSFDAFHLACAERGKCKVLLTTDDRFIRLAIRHGMNLKVRVLNPVDWLQEKGGGL